MDLEPSTGRPAPSRPSPDGAADPLDLLDPVEDDVALAVAAQQRLGATALTRSDDPDRACGRCRHFLNPGHDLAYCWHPDQRSLVDAAWVCTAFARDDLDEG